MRYLTFSLPGHAMPRLGVLTGTSGATSGGRSVVDLGSLNASADVAPVPTSMLELIQRGPAYWTALAAFLTRELQRAGRQQHAIDAVRWHAPLPRPAKNIVCLGLNYASHAIESAAARGRDPKIPKDPVFFTKAPTTVAGAFDDIPVDRHVTGQVDWEAELGVIVGRGGKNIAASDALGHVFGYTIINDVTARDLQTKHIQWFKGKSLDGFAPMGPCIVTADEFGDPQAKRIACRVNGVTKQDATTRDMIFPVAAIIEILSQGLTLEPGDVISTGTPEGVGMGRTPQEFLVDGDVVETEIESIGVMRNKVRELGRPAAHTA